MRTKTNRTIYPYLAYSGAIPFIFCAISLWSNTESIPFLGSVEKLLSAYGLLISSFLAGAHWGQHLNLQVGSLRHTLAILSNVVAISLWIAYLVLPFNILIMVFAGVFTALLFIDYRLFQLKVITPHYFRTRCLVSTIVIASLIISGIVS